MKIFFKILLTSVFLTIIVRYFPIRKYSITYDIQDHITIIKQPLEEKILSKMSIEEKVGQLFIFGFNGTTLSKDTQDLIEYQHIGGVILMGKNISNPSQLTSLNTDLQSVSKIPLLISIDQEGGSVSRIRWENILTTSPKSMGGEKNIYDISVQRSLLLKEYGINVNFSPVVEYITNNNSFLYPRVFTGTKEEVARKSYYAMKGYSDSGIIPVAKHYPGHNDSSVDSHYNLPRVNISPYQWDEYVSVFKYLIEKDVVDVIMVGHLLFPNIDSKPSTISEVLLNGKLREDMGYEGVVITDDMQMGAIEKQGTVCILALQSLKAGNDMLLYTFYSPKPNLQTEVYNCILDAVKSNQLEDGFVERKVLRILRLKIKYNIVDESILHSLE